MIDEDPHLIKDDALAKVWFKYDHRFKQPKVYLTYQIETPHTYRSPKNLQLAKLYEAAVQEGLNELVYPIQIAGLSYSLSVGKKGVVLTIGGYSERINDLLKIVTQNLMEIRIDPQKFNNIKEAMVRGLKNRKLGQAYSRGGYYNWLMLLDEQYTEEEKLQALLPLSLDDVKAYAKTLYEKVFITGLIHGNYNDKKAIENTNILIDSLKSQPLAEKDRYKQIVEKMPKGKRFSFSREVKDNNNSYLNSGIAQTWEFAHPSNKELTGPLSKFILMMNSPSYLSLIHI